MSDSWWVGEGDLDDDQKAVIKLDIDGNHLVLGPPGSGKTNLLLLRANYLHLAGRTNLLIVVFTRTLRDFIAAGAAEYHFPPSKIVTCRQWQQDFLRENGVPFKLPDGFEAQRNYLSDKIETLIDKEALTELYEGILLDEAHDYLPREIVAFHKLSERLFSVADPKQKIYSNEDPMSALRAASDKEISLRYNYRNGIQICKVADGIARHADISQSLEASSNYIEKANPSHVEHCRCGGIDEQAKIIIGRLDAQLKAFPNEHIGIICPKHDEVKRMWSIIESSRHSPKATLQLGNDRILFDESKPIIVCTYHAIKGLEVRALHMACCDSLRKFELNRNMAYTAVTRAKTSLSIYYTNDIHGYIEAALKTLEPIPNLPQLTEVFGGESNNVDS